MLQAFDQPLCSYFWAAFVKVITAQLSIRFMTLDEMIDNYQDRMFQGDNGFFIASTTGQAMILSRQVGVLGMGSCMSRLVQRHAQRTVAFARPTRAALAGTFIIA